MTSYLRTLLILGLAVSSALPAAAQDKKSKKEEATLRVLQGTVFDKDEKPVEARWFS